MGQLKDIVRGIVVDEKNNNAGRREGTPVTIPLNGTAMLAAVLAVGLIVVAVSATARDSRPPVVIVVPPPATAVAQ